MTRSPRIPAALRGPGSRKTPCRFTPLLPAAFVGTLLLCLAPPTFGEPITGSVTAGWAWRSDSGSLGAFKSQVNLGTGLFLEDIDVRMAGGGDDREVLTLTGWGLGGAEPSEAAKLRFAPNRCWRVDLGYDRRFSSFQLVESDLGLRSDTWNLTRLRGSVTYEGFEHIRVSVAARHHDRSGDVVRPFFGLNSIYPLAVTLDQTFTEAALKLESKSLGPWYAALEQAFGWSVRKDRWAPGGTGSIQYPLTGAESSRQDERSIPTTRAAVSYRSDRFETVGAFLFSRASLDANPQASVTFGLEQGSIGHVAPIDQTVGSATADSLSGSLRLGLDLGAGWAVRFLGDGRDSTTDATLLGQRLLKLTSPVGSDNTISGPVNEASSFDVRTLSGRLQLEKSFTGVTLWAGGLVASREVSWQETREKPLVENERKTSGVLAGFAVNLNKALRLDAEYEHGSFEQYIFRTEPETVDRFSGRLRATLAKGLGAALYGRWEKGTNPSEVAGLSRKATSGGVSLDYGAEIWSLTAAADFNDYHNEIGILLPGTSSTPATSIYDISLVTISISGRVHTGPVQLDASGARTEDRGDSWPLASWTASGRITCKLRMPLALGAFFQHWFYDEERSDGDDFEVSRYGLLARWDF